MLADPDGATTRVAKYIHGVGDPGNNLVVRIAEISPQATVVVGLRWCIGDPLNIRTPDNVAQLGLSTCHEIVARYAQWGIIGLAEMRRPLGVAVSPWRA